MIFNLKNIHYIERTEHVLEELDICAIKVYVYYYYYYVMSTTVSYCFSQVETIYLPI